MVRGMVWVHSLMPMVKNTLEIGLKVKCMVRALTFGLAVKPMMVIIKTINTMALVPSNCLMENITLDIGRMGKCMVKVNTLILTAHSSMEITKMVISMVMVP